MSHILSFSGKCFKFYYIIVKIGTNNNEINLKSVKAFSQKMIAGYHLEQN